MTRGRVEIAKGILNEIIINVKKCREFLHPDKASEYNMEAKKYIDKYTIYKNKLEPQ